MIESPTRHQFSPDTDTAPMPPGRKESRGRPRRTARLRSAHATLEVLLRRARPTAPRTGRPLPRRRLTPSVSCSLRCEAISGQSAGRAPLPIVHGWAALGYRRLPRLVTQLEVDPVAFSHRAGAKKVYRGGTRCSRGVQVRARPPRGSSRTVEHVALNAFSLHRCYPVTEQTRSRNGVPRCGRRGQQPLQSTTSRHDAVRGCV